MDLNVFDLLTIRPGPPGNMGGGVDSLAGNNVLTIAVQAPISAVVRPDCNITNAADMNCVVGMWTTTSRQSTRVLNGEQAPTFDGDWVQVSRLSAALVNEVEILAAKAGARLIERGRPRTSLERLFLEATAAPKKEEGKNS